MALIPTHIRFALDVAKQFPISDLRRYISGTVYPDSRWLSGIERDLTHHARFSKPEFPNDDFTYGWHVHCVCDELQKQVHESLFDNLDHLEKQDRWIQLSVAKVIQDMNDQQHLDLWEVMDHLDHVETPNNESFDLVKKFYQTMQKTYRRDTVPTPDEYGELWINVGLEEPTTVKLIELLKVQLKNARLVHDLENSYDAILQLFQQQYPKQLYR